MYSLCVGRLFIANCVYLSQCILGTDNSTDPPTSYSEPSLIQPTSFFVISAIQLGTSGLWRLSTPISRGKRKQVWSHPFSVKQWFSPSANGFYTSQRNNNRSPKSEVVFTPKFRFVCLPKGCSFTFISYKYLRINNTLFKVLLNAKPCGQY